jgi:hypothetical protein
VIITGHEYAKRQAAQKGFAFKDLDNGLAAGDLDLGHPDRVALIFDRQIRRRGKHLTRGRFRTRVITEGVTPKPAYRRQTQQDQAVPSWASRRAPRQRSTTRKTSSNDDPAATTTDSPTLACKPPSPTR